MKGMEKEVSKQDDASTSKQEVSDGVSSEDGTFEVVNIPDVSDVVEDVEVIK